ncbi:thioredoxin family protein [Pontibacter sp. E15-1]|uniref:thioredoxin family protein n=1 Tax=Pontibacter sp. E15-1 TaxID=2919918 RepID=UPI001F50252E|nr:thioredoxin family protein [Pontibacter sp. E15-1]MCJ8165771.1 thioredoxin family protein [Pontibacter sp. E15-1]
MTTTPNRTTPITPAHLAKAISYGQYRDMIDRLLAEGKTTGSNHAADMLEYTRMNMHRMRRVEKTTVLKDELVQLLLSVETQMTWVVLTEAWCGDAAQSLPAIVKIADASPLIDVRLLLRDEHPELMDAYLTNGGRAIPKLIALNAATLEVLGTWGPRPEPAQKLFLEAKANNVPYKEFAELLHGWYAKDRSHTLQEEFMCLLSHWSALTAPQDQVVARCS